MPYNKGENPNHPKAGSVLDTEPIRSRDAVNSIRQYLLSGGLYREYLLFVLGINSALRVKDLLNLKKIDLVKLNPMQRVFVCRETKTGKVRRVIANDAVIEAVSKCGDYLSQFGDDDYVFVGKRGRIQSSTVTAWVKSWTDAIGLKGSYGGRSLRKTWVYHCIEDGIKISTLMEMLNHSSQAITLRYVGIRDKDTDNAYLKVQL